MKLEKVRSSSSSHALSVVIVNWNGRDKLRDCLVGLSLQSDREFETVVVDNASCDDSVDMLRREFAWVAVVELDNNVGFAEGCNVGIARTSGSWIATLNNDARPRPRWIEVMRDAICCAEQHVGMLQSCVVFKKDPGRTNSTGVLLLTNGTAVDREFDAPVRVVHELEDVFCAMAGAAVYRRAMLVDTQLSTGFFDRTFFMYFEDVDLGWRCRLAGWSAMYVPAAVVEHEFEGSSCMHERRFIGLHLRRNRIRLLLKNGSWPLIARTLPRSLFDLCEMICWKGPKVLCSFVQAVQDGWRQRAAVRLVSRMNRREVERRWLVPSGSSRFQVVGQPLR